MNLGNFHYERCPSDYPSRPIFCDSHNNISISAVISSSCVVLEGLRDNSDCLSSVFPVGQDGQAFFPSEFHSSLPTSVAPSDAAIFPTCPERFNVSNSLDCPTVSLSYGNHFFESAASEFTLPGDDLGANPSTSNINSSFLTEDESDGVMRSRSNGIGNFVGDNQAESTLPVGAVFNRGHGFAGSHGFDLYCPEEVADNDCRFAMSNNSSFHSSNLHVDQITASACQHALDAKSSTVYQGDINAPFPAADKRVDQRGDVDYSSNDSCIQNQDHSPLTHRSQTSNYQSDDQDMSAGHLEMNTLQKRSFFPIQNNTVCYNSTSSNQPKSLVSFTMNSSFNSVSSGPDSRDNMCDSLSNNSCAFVDSCHQTRLPFTCGSENNINSPESIEDEKNYSNQSLESSQRHQSILHKYAPGKDVEFPSKRHYSDHNVQNSECLYTKRSASLQENGEFVSSPSDLSYDDAGRSIDDIDTRSSEKPARIVGGSKPKRKHAETVESLQQHLETLDDRRKKMALSCSYLNILRQRSQGMEEQPGAEQNGTGVIDVDHMMCSGVTVAGFKPRAIIRKRSKTATPTDVKDMEYWQKRRKNNDSARKSRESKKEKEKNFYKRALELEYENIYLQECLSLAETELATLGHPFVPPVFGGQYYY